MGAIVDGKSPVIVRNEDVIGAVGVDDKHFKAICDKQLAEIERRRMRYLGDRARAEVSGRTAIVVDDGVATGATMRAALRATRQRGPKRLILAVPVAPPDAIAELREEADEVVCLETHAFFGAIGAYYLDFRQIEDEDVSRLLALFPAQKAESPGVAAAPIAAKP
jgi:predicted phosphoribosyltransferase